MEPIACFMLDDAELDRTAFVGAMFWWHHTRKPNDRSPRPLPHLAVITPAGLVCLDCPASNGAGYWMRSGRAPRVTVTPSLNVSDGAWHGFLSGGHLHTLDTTVRGVG